MIGQGKLPALHAELGVSLPGSECSLIMCPPPREAEGWLAKGVFYH